MFTLQTLPAEPDAPRPEVAESSGFSLHAGIAAKASQRDKVERLARYVSRPPVATERLSLTQAGNVRYALKTPYRDGTTHVIFEIDIETCRQCGGRLRVIASIEQHAVIERILGHLVHTAVPVDPAHPSRALPQGDCLV